jgi:hypothetical protein
MAIQKPLPFAQMIWTIIEDKFFKDEIILEFHSFVRIISGEMKVVQADRAYVFGAGSTLLFPRNQLSAVIKQPKDGKAYKAVVLGFTLECLKTFYAKHTPAIIAAANYKVMVFDSHLLLESFFASLMPYFELEQKLPKSVYC